MDHFTGILPSNLLAEISVLNSCQHRFVDPHRVIAGHYQKCCIFDIAKKRLVIESSSFPSLLSRTKFVGGIVRSFIVTETAIADSSFRNEMTAKVTRQSKFPFFICLGVPINTVELIDAVC